MSQHSINLLLFIPLFSFSLNVTGQHIDPTSSFKSIEAKKYFRFHYDNDFFTKADKYYSQGITLEYSNPELKNNPLNRVLIKPKNSLSRYGIAFNIFGYTPSSIFSDSILYGDRPYAAALTFTSFITGIDTVSKKRISSTLNMGMIGPAAFGNEIQTGIHRWLDNAVPHGWQYQVRNNLILNYQVNYEKQLLSSPGNFSLNGLGEIRAGTLNDRISLGFNLMAGHFNDPFRTKNDKKFRYYFYGQARGNVVGYDATLQGGLFDKRSPYTINRRDINRLTFLAEGGIVFSYQKLFLTYHQAYQTKEFSGGKYHRWGGINLGTSL